MEDLNLRLKVFSQWLKNQESNSIENNLGIIEKKIEESNIELMWKIGDLLDEILNMDDSQIEIELKD